MGRGSDEVAISNFQRYKNRKYRVLKGIIALLSSNQARDMGHVTQKDGINAVSNFSEALVVPKVNISVTIERKVTNLLDTQMHRKRSSRSQETKKQ